MTEVRKIKEGELSQLMALYSHLHPGDEQAQEQDLSTSWQKILRSECFHFFVIEKDQQLVSSCNLSIVPNLTRGARPIGLIENVVTHTDYRKQGLAKKILEHALNYARDMNCYKLMLLSSNKNTEAHHLYERLGLKSDLKKGFIIKL